MRSQGSTRVQSRFAPEDPLAEAADGRAPTTLPYSDLNPRRWKEYTDIILDSLWLLGRRDSSGPHSAEYWGNFVPQIPYQLMRRYTKQGDLVLDMFSGLGTTLIECRRLGRKGIGIEISAKVLDRSQELIHSQPASRGAKTRMILGDSGSRETVEAVRAAASALGKSEVDLVILHPPYWDIIKFSGEPKDLSGAKDLSEFLVRFGEIVGNAYELLAPGHFLGLVIGDKYTGGEWIPLGFECMDVCRREGFTLKAINVKDIQGNERGKGKRENLWRFRALSQGFYLFKHEYVMVFQKPRGP